MIKQRQVRKEVRRGDIVIVNLKGALGSEQKKVRPCLVVQNDTGNKYSSVTIVVPIGHKHVRKRLLPTQILINDNDVCEGEVEGVVLGEQIRAIDKSRITRYGVAQMSNKFMAKVDRALRVSIGL